MAGSCWQMAEAKEPQCSSVAAWSGVGNRRARGRAGSPQERAVASPPSVETCENPGNIAPSATNKPRELPEPAPGGGCLPNVSYVGKDSFLG